MEIQKCPKCHVLFGPNIEKCSRCGGKLIEAPGPKSKKTQIIDNKEAVREARVIAGRTDFLYDKESNKI